MSWRAGQPAQRNTSSHALERPGQSRSVPRLLGWRLHAAVSRGPAHVEPGPEGDSRFAELLSWRSFWESYTILHHLAPCEEVFVPGRTLYFPGIELGVPGGVSRDGACSMG